MIDGSSRLNFGGGGEAELFLVTFILGIGAIVFIIAVFFCLSLQKALILTGADNRRMSPGLVWLNLIPIFNLGWIIYTTLKISEAITAKNKQNGVADPEQGAKAVGLVFSISTATFIVPVSLVSGLMYWLKISDYNKSMSKA